MPKKEYGEAELVGTFEVGAFNGIEDHKIKGVMKSSVNKPLTGLNAEHSQRVFGERFEIYKRKIGAHINPHGEMVAVEKEWQGVQKPSGSPSARELPSKQYAETDYPEDIPTKDGTGMTPFQVLKNMVDNHSKDIRMLSFAILIVALISAIALGGVIFK